MATLRRRVQQWNGARLVRNAAIAFDEKLGKHEERRGVLLRGRALKAVERAGLVLGHVLRVRAQVVQGPELVVGLHVPFVARLSQQPNALGHVDIILVAPDALE